MTRHWWLLFLALAASCGSPDDDLPQPQPSLELFTEGFEGDMGSATFGTVGTVSSYQLVGENLSGPVTVAPSPGFTVYDNSELNGTGGTAESPLVIAVDGGSVSLDLWVAFTPRGELGADYVGGITHTTEGVDPVVLPLSGTGLPPALLTLQVENRFLASRNATAGYVWASLCDGTLLDLQPIVDGEPLVLTAPADFVPGTSYLLTLAWGDTNGSDYTARTYRGVTATSGVLTANNELSSFNRVSLNFTDNAGNFPNQVYGSAALPFLRHRSDFISEFEGFAETFQSNEPNPFEFLAIYFDTFDQYRDPTNAPAYEFFSFSDGQSVSLTEADFTGNQFLSLSNQINLPDPTLQWSISVQAYRQPYSQNQPGFQLAFEHNVSGTPFYSLALPGFEHYAYRLRRLGFSGPDEEYWFRGSFPETTFKIEIDDATPAVAVSNTSADAVEASFEEGLSAAVLEFDDGGSDSFFIDWEYWCDPAEGAISSCPLPEVPTEVGAALPDLVLGRNYFRWRAYRFAAGDTYQGMVQDQVLGSAKDLLEYTQEYAVRTDF